jgi:hypothetical protein
MPTALPKPVEDGIAEYLAAALTASSWDGPIASFQAEVDECPEWDAAEGDLNILRVAVVPAPEMEFQLRETRGADLHRPTIGLLMSKKISDPAERQTLRALRTQILDRIRRSISDPTVFQGVTPSLPPEYQLVSIDVETTFDRQGMGGPRVFMAAIRLVYVALLAPPE